MNLKINNTHVKQHKDLASFRDPAGFIFYQNDEIYRHISPTYYQEYKKFKALGLYQELSDKGYLIPFEEIQKESTPDGEALIIKPRKVPFISYPYEWTFGQLKEAAKLTLEIQKIALQYGLQLKDASSYNIQFIGSKPVFIDTLSFESWTGDVMWKAYKQFCQHFLAPLTICSFCDPRMKSLFVSNLDGIPLDLAKRLIPKKAYLSPSRFLHLWLHENFQKFKKPERAEITTRASSLKQPSSSAFGLVESLLSSFKHLKRKQEKSVWKAYYKGDSYQEKDFEEKKSIISKLLFNLKPKMLWDLGSNEGLLTEIVAEHCQYSLAFDLDLTCIETMYDRLRMQRNKIILPLHMDIANPSPGIGWESRERAGLIERGPCDVAMALALIHHLIVSSNIPLNKVVDFFKKTCTHLIIEYVPPSDPKFRQICQTNPHDFSFFTEEAFVIAFSESFILKSRIPIGQSSRVLYHFQLRGKA
jgi:hypothetical protein